MGAKHFKELRLSHSLTMTIVYFQVCTAVKKFYADVLKNVMKTDLKCSCVC